MSTAWGREGVESGMGGNCLRFKVSGFRFEVDQYWCDELRGDDRDSKKKKIEKNEETKRVDRIKMIEKLPFVRREQ